ncbi:hypothetical protein BU17DRAFT_91593 [Hysterangium stoloniferum]|nr:hypothetical protein BU17DRAFT_91593 [Hysterangium stoloniferum]
MTLYIPLDLKDKHPNSPPFLVSSPTPETHLTAAVQSILKAKRITVVCGAGISVGAGIPDFRSQDGLFQSLKRDNPKASLSSGKDLFDASVFKSTQKTALFYRMIASLASLSSQGQPTVFHQLLRTLDERGQLLRVYTQNIDALEMKAGLSFGVPEFEEKKLRVLLKGKAKVKAKEAGIGAYSAKHGSGRGKRPLQDAAASLSIAEASPPRSGMLPSPDLPVLPAKPQLNVIPRCIPLHGTLLTLHCPHCTQSFPLEPPPPNSVTPMSPPPSPTATSSKPPSLSPSPPPSLHSLLADGTPPPCPSCTSLEQTRALVGKRLRGIGKLRPSVVLYGEEHREGEGVGEAVRRDLCGIPDAKGTSSSGAPDKDKPEPASPSKSRLRAGRGPDLLLVVGTSLRVPGTKRIVREFSKAVRPTQSPSPSRMPTPAPTPSPPAGESKSEPIRTIYLNNEFPLSSREWEGVFDVWVDGDAQSFAKMAGEMIREHEQTKARKKQKAAVAKEQAAASDKFTNEIQFQSLSQSQSPSTASKGKRKADTPREPSTPSKRYRPEVVIPPTPFSLPRPGKAAAVVSSDALQPTQQLSHPRLFEAVTPQPMLQLPPLKPLTATAVSEFPTAIPTIIPTAIPTAIPPPLPPPPPPPPPPQSRRRVILRLPPPPAPAPAASPTAPPPKPPLKRKHSPPDDDNDDRMARARDSDSESPAFTHRPYPIARSPSPLTSLSSLSSRNSLSPPPPLSPCVVSRAASVSSATTPAVRLWQGGRDRDRDRDRESVAMSMSMSMSMSVPRSVDLGQSDADDEDAPLSESFPRLRRGAGASEDGFSNRAGSWQLPVYA